MRSLLSGESPATRGGQSAFGSFSRAFPRVLEVRLRDDFLVVLREALTRVARFFADFLLVDFLLFDLLVFPAAMRMLSTRLG